MTFWQSIIWLAQILQDHITVEFVGICVFVPSATMLICPLDVEDASSFSRSNPRVWAAHEEFLEEKADILDHVFDYVLDTSVWEDQL